MSNRFVHALVFLAGSYSSAAFNWPSVTCDCVFIARRVKLHPKSAAARDADTKIRKAYTRIEDIDRTMRGGGDSGVAGGVGVGSIGNR